MQMGGGDKWGLIRLGGGGQLCERGECEECEG